MTNFALMNASKSPAKQLERAKRRAKVMQIVEQHPEYNLEEIAAAMRKDPWIEARWPAYSTATAQKDFGKVMALVKGDVKEIAMPYLARNITISDAVIQVLGKFIADDNLGHKLRIDAANSLRSYLDQSNKVFGNYAPKETHLTTTEMKMNLNEFYKIEQAAQKQLSEVIEGELVEQDIPRESGDDGENEGND
jgi:NRPS condensation-like uncharacterized protein